MNPNTTMNTNTPEILKDLAEQLVEIKQAAKTDGQLALFNLAKAVERLLQMVEHQGHALYVYDGGTVVQYEGKEAVPLTDSFDNVLNFQTALPQAWPQPDWLGAVPMPTAPATAAPQPPSVPTKAPIVANTTTTAVHNPQFLNDNHHMTLVLRATLDKPVDMNDTNKRNELRDIIAGRAYTINNVLFVEVL